MPVRMGWVCRSVWLHSQACRDLQCRQRTFLCLFSLQSEHSGGWSDSATSLARAAMATVLFIMKAWSLTVTCKVLPALVLYLCHLSSHSSSPCPLGSSHPDHVCCLLYTLGTHLDLCFSSTSHVTDTLILFTILLRCHFFKACALCLV